jgi:uncharacterized protein YjaG (DUF416 family)
MLVAQSEVKADASAEMAILKFDDVALVRALGHLPSLFRVAFAAASAERLLPGYVMFARRTDHKNPGALTTLLDRLWLDLEGKPMHAGLVQESIDRAMSLIPAEDAAPWVPERALADDAASAVAYALRCRQSGEPQEAALAARRAYEALDHFVITQEKIDIQRPEGELQVRSHPLVQAELSRQRLDLNELHRADPVEFATAARQIHRTAKDASRLVFGATRR